MNKQGKKGSNAKVFVAVGVVAVLVVLAFMFLPSLSQNINIQTGSTDPEKCGDSTGILTINAVSALEGGTDPSGPTITAGVNGGAVATAVTSGTTTFPVGAKLEILVSKADYIDQKFDAVMGCGGLVADVEMFYSTSDNPAIRIKNDDGDFMTDASTGGAINQTDLALGETLNLEVELQGTNGEASGDGIYVIEFPASTSANITSVTLNGQQPVALPSVHSSVNAGSKIVAFDVSSVEGATKKTMTLSIVLGSGKDLAGGVLTDWYAKQYFIDDDKTIQYGVEDSDGTAKYENTLDYDFYVN